MIVPFADRLRIKYGLTDNPDDAAIARWVGRADELISSGEDQEQAGRKAALIVFGELDGIFYFSQADTIEALLALAKAKQVAIGRYRTGREDISGTGVGLRIKYRLRAVPTDPEAAEWAALTERYGREGFDLEEAGRRAADELFEIVPDLVLKSEADTIEALLEQARKKK